MAITFAWLPKNLKQPTSYDFVTGKRITQKCKKFDWSVKHDLASKIVHNTEKWQIRYLLSEKNIFFEVYY